MSKKFRNIVFLRIAVLVTVFCLLSLLLSGSINPFVTFSILFGSLLLAVTLGCLSFLVLYKAREQRPLKFDIASDIGWPLILPIMLIGGVFLWSMEGRSDTSEQILGFISFFIVVMIPFETGWIITAEIDKRRNTD